jgi:hypothetical protein
VLAAGIIAYWRIDTDAPLSALLSGYALGTLALLAAFNMMRGD